MNRRSGSGRGISDSSPPCVQRVSTVMSPCLSRSGEGVSMKALSAVKYSTTPPGVNTIRFVRLFWRRRTGALRGLPFDQSKRQGDVLEASTGFCHLGEQDFSRQPTGFVQVLANGCQIHEPGEVDVVETHDGEILWD